jgi:hypothetical protein
MTWQQAVNDGLLRIVWAERRIDPYLRPFADRLVKPPLQVLAQWLINVTRRDEGLALAEEHRMPDEEKITAAIAEQMSRFLEREYRFGTAERAGNTKTYGIVRAEFTVRDGLPAHLRHGVFREPVTYPAWVRFAGPGPLSPPDIKDNGILSVGIKLMRVPGRKLLDDERFTQDFTGLTAPMFTTPNIVANLQLQQHVYAGTPVLYFLGPRRSHLRDALMQVLYAKTSANPLEERYWSCVPFLLGDGQAMQYTLLPRGEYRSRVPWNPPDDYLRQAMVATLGAREVVFDFMIQIQADAHRMPIENAMVVWPERLSPFVPVATLRVPQQRFDSPEQLAMAQTLSINPWHCIAEHRPLGNQNRARRGVYLTLSRLRQAMNGVPHVEPTPHDTVQTATLPGSAPA